MRRAPSRASSSRLGPTTAAAVVAIALRSGILCMGGVSFLAPRGRSRSLQPEGYAAFFMPPVHNLRVYLATTSAPTITPIDDQTIGKNGSTGDLPFTIGDPDTNVNSLTLSRLSSNAVLVPATSTNIAFGGTGAS